MGFFDRPKIEIVRLLPLTDWQCKEIKDNPKYSVYTDKEGDHFLRVEQTVEQIFNTIKDLDKLATKMLKNDEKASQLKSKPVKGNFLKNF